MIDIAGDATMRVSRLASHRLSVVESSMFEFLSFLRIPALGQRYHLLWCNIDSAKNEIFQPHPALQSESTQQERYI
jgi:hypothetical protein